MKRANRNPVVRPAAATRVGRRRITTSASLNISAKLRSLIVSASWSRPSAALSKKAAMFGRSSKDRRVSRTELAKSATDWAASFLRRST